MCSNNKKISEIIRNRFEEQGIKYFSNDSIAEYITEEEKAQLLEEVTENMEKVLQSLVIDTKRDHNTQDTARRVAKMFIKETFSGRYETKPKITTFPNVLEYDQLYVTGPITIRSVCAHHFQNIVGKAYVGIFPGEKVIGLSKFNRLIDWIASRPQIQEEMTIQIAKAIEEETQALGVGIIIRAEHMCMTARGVKEHESDMTTSIMLGKFREDPSLKAELLSLIGQMK